MNNKYYIERDEAKKKDYYWKGDKELLGNFIGLQEIYLP